MSGQIDIDTGPAAPPRLNGELAFTHPWQTRLFATVMALCEQGILDYEEFRAGLISQIARRDASGLEADVYWEAWQDAVEDLVSQRAWSDNEEISARAIDFHGHH